MFGINGLDERTSQAGCGWENVMLCHVSIRYTRNSFKKMYDEVTEGARIGWRWFGEEMEDILSDILPLDSSN